MWKVAIFCSILHIAHASCPAGFDLYKNGECRGKYTTVPSRWDEEDDVAVTKCAEIGGEPVIIHSEEDNQYWLSRIDPFFHNDFVLGLVCNATTKRLEWADGSAIDFLPADNVQNNNPDLSQECMPFDCSYSLVRDGWWDGGCGTVITSADIYCTTQLHQPIPNPDGCAGFDDDSEDGVCYQIGATATNWAEAQKICKTFGGNLASIHNTKENSFVRRLAVSKGAVNAVFLGATVMGKGNQYGWIDGSNWDYSNFYPGFPIDGIGECVAMDTSTSAGQWMNFDCSTELPVACVRDQLQYTEPTCTGTGKEGEIITSPGFPYSASTPCDYFLTVKAGKKVELEIVFLEANSCCDSLTLYDGNLGGNVIAKITGEVRNVTYTTSATNIMKVSWQPNGGVNVQGLMMMFRGV